ncbi:MAG: hypothetical protein AB2L12_10035 [Smithellaceae bacterium]
MNLSQLKLGRKLSIGFSIVLFFTAIVALCGMERITNLQQNVASVQAGIVRMGVIYELSKDYSRTDSGFQSEAGLRYIRASCGPGRVIFIA